MHFSRTRVQSWLTEGGYETPRSVEVNPRIGYAGAMFSVPEEVVPSVMHPACWSATRVFLHNAGMHRCGCLVAQWLSVPKRE